MHHQAIVDTHLHLWDPERLQYSWLDGTVQLNRRHEIGDYHASTAGLPISHMVFLQCDCDPAQRDLEIAYVKEAAVIDARLQGIVPYAPIETGDAVRGELEALAEDSVIKGVRRILQGEGDRAFCLRPDFVRGVALLGELDLHFEICVNHRQLESAVELVRRCPGTRFILDHIGKPDIKGGVLSPWKEEIAALAALPNVWCKVSGMVTEANRDAWTTADLRPYANAIFESFGFDRIMYGSDWPVSTLASTYRRWLETLEVLTAGCTEDEKDRLFRRNAFAFYRLT